MNALPSLIIVADRGHQIAYRSNDNGSLEKIASSAVEEGNKKISEIVSDQAGVFANPGGYGLSSAERLPMVEELEVRCVRKIAITIAEWVAKEDARWWCFAAPSEINGAILDALDDGTRDKLSTNLKLDLTNSPPADVEAKFRKARAMERSS